MNGVELRIKGKVQGVGFRPFVWRLANQYQLKGDVNNDGQGVLIRLLTPNPHQLVAFLTELQRSLPPLAKITEIQRTEKHWENLPHFETFIIRESENNAMDTQIIPDAATCSACLKELFDPDNRRFHYPFINCTHCGPRFTIINAVPYDRKNTSMAIFPFCPNCEKEYKTPTDRRFHAQPNACPTCGPHIWLQDQTQNIADHEMALKQTALLLVQGKIIAIKGVGGFHLACDATNSAAVQLLRERKRRPSKPLAIMVPDLDFLTDLTQQEIDVLNSPASPILLLKKNKVANVCEQIAPNLNEIGVMLPNNPLQHLLLREINRPLVMTSANPSGEPPVLDNQSAVKFLNHLADFYLCHNRDILQRADDSLVRIAFDGLETLRRARGYVPDENLLEVKNRHHILALGADLKNTFCLLKGDKAVISQYIGDTENEKVRTQLSENLNLFQRIYQFSPTMIVADKHPAYFSTKLGKQLAINQKRPFVQILHHHAHIASVMAEHHYSKPAIGIALDGIGMGENQQLWGGECLLVTPTECRHLGGLPAVALPGGNIAAIQPWRNWLAHIKAFVPHWKKLASETCQSYSWQILSNAIDQKLNCPRASSTGRFFDAIAYQLGIAPATLSWEGEAACYLETLASRSRLMSQSAVEIREFLPIYLPIKNNVFELAHFWQKWLKYEADKADKAFAFHFALAEGFSRMASLQAKKNNCDTIILSGGVMHNQLLRRLIKQNLSDFNLLSAHHFPMNDGGLSLGQAYIAALRESSYCANYELN